MLRCTKQPVNISLRQGGKDYKTDRIDATQWARLYAIVLAEKVELPESEMERGVPDGILSSRGKSMGPPSWAARN